jgi:hypothetical protein
MASRFPSPTDLICGRPALARELRAIACPCYAPASLDVAVSDDLAELCEAYGIAIPVSKVPEERRVTGNAF